jgi:carbonic anhydrase
MNNPMFSTRVTRILQILSLLLVAAALLTPARMLGGESSQAAAKAEGIVTLQGGNDRYLSGNLKSKDFTSERSEQAAGQHPYAIVVTCSDSRVSPEILFDESLGRLFVIRVAGNVIDPVVMGSIEYAVEHLHSETVLILGHSSCGAVSAALAGGTVPENIGAIIQRIQPAVDAAKKKSSDADEVKKASVSENIALQMTSLTRGSEIVREAVKEGKLTVAGGLYDITTGKVRFFPFVPQAH